MSQSKTNEASSNHANSHATLELTEYSRKSVLYWTYCGRSSQSACWVYSHFWGVSRVEKPQQTWAWAMDTKPVREACGLEEALCLALQGDRMANVLLAEGSEWETQREATFKRGEEGPNRHRQKEVAEVVAGKRDGRVAVGGRRVRRGT